MGAVKTWNGIARASVKTFDGIAVASVSTINGFDATSGGTVYFEDNFNRADSGTVGGSWTSQTGAVYGITSNAMVGAITDNSAQYVTINGTELEGWIQFTFKTSSLALGSNNASTFRVLTVGGSFTVKLLTGATGNWSGIRLSLFDDAFATTNADYNFTPVVDTVYTFKLYYKYAAGTDGAGTLYLDGTSRCAISGKDNNGRGMTSISLGGVVWPNTAPNSYTLTFDSFVWRSNDSF